MSSQDWFNKDFYAILGVPKSASEADIKKAYRKLARDLHPDRNPGDESAKKRFQEIGEAYGVLSNAEQRQQYDAIRAMGGGSARFQAGGPGGGQAGFEDVFSSMFGGGGQQRAQGFEDILGGLFGGFGGRGPEKGSDVAAATEVSFRQAAQGATVALNVGGERVSTRLPAGVADGKKIRIRGKGRPGSGGGPRGDLILTVHVAKHPVYTVDGQHLRMSLPVTFAEAVQGATVEVPTLAGERVRVKVPAGTSSGTTLRVKGKGLATKSGTGDLLVRVEIQVPSKLDKAAKQALADFAGLTSGHDPRADLYDKAAS